MSIKLSLGILYQLTYHTANQILYLEILIYFITYIEKYIFYHSCLQELEHERERREIFQIETIYKKLSIILISMSLFYAILLFWCLFID